MARHVPPQHLELEPRAGDFLELLRDLGHLDDAAIDRITGSLVTAGRAGRVVGFQELRTAVALHLFDGEAALRPEARDALNAEWPRLFS